MLVGHCIGTLAPGPIPPAAIILRNVSTATQPFVQHESLPTSVRSSFAPFEPLREWPAGPRAGLLSFWLERPELLREGMTPEHETIGGISPS